jgi:hypothetical protein
MEEVIDVNFLRHPTLDDYLRKGSRNRVVFTDYACMECYKGNALENIRRSLEIVAKYPKQVIVLKGTREIIRLQANGHQVPANFVDSQQTDAFRDFCRHVRLALQGDLALRSQLLNLGEMANAHFKQMCDDASGVANAIRQIAQSFLPGQLAELRGRRALSKETGDVIVQNILTLAALLFKEHPDIPNLPTADTLRATFLFRFALAAQLLVVRWLRDGGIESIGMDRLRNDVVDMTYVAYATLFDGILSNDRKLLEIHEEAVFFLRSVFAQDTDQPIPN